LKPRRIQGKTSSLQYSVMVWPGYLLKRASDPKFIAIYDLPFKQLVWGRDVGSAKFA